jgi:hypothetical protein
MSNMDIAAIQAQAAAKTSAWLGTALPSDADQALQGKGEPLSPLVPVATTPVVPAPTTPASAEAKPGLSESIRRDREARAAAAAAQSEAGKYKGEVETLRKEVEALKSLGAATDPFDFLKHRKLTKEQQALWGQAFLYDLKPEVAPQEFRLELYKAEQARKEQAQAEAAERQAAEQMKAAEKAQLDRYADDLMQHVQTAAGSNPESEDWFTVKTPEGTFELDHRAYAQSLLATANNLAATAAREGRQANLSPENIARVLEAEVAVRMERRDARRASKAKTETQVKPVTAQGGAQAAMTTTTSAEGLRSGAPTPPDLSDEARRARAAAAMFGTK